MEVKTGESTKLMRLAELEGIVNEQLSHFPLTKSTISILISLHNKNIEEFNSQLNQTKNQKGLTLKKQESLIRAAENLYAFVQDPDKARIILGKKLFIECELRAVTLNRILATIHLIESKCRRKQPMALEKNASNKIIQTSELQSPSKNPAELLTLNELEAIPEKDLAQFIFKRFRAWAKWLEEGKSSFVLEETNICLSHIASCSVNKKLGLDVAIFYFQGEAYLQLEDYAESIRCQKNALIRRKNSHCPFSLHLYYGCLGKAYQHLQQHTLAIEAFTSAINDLVNLTVKESIGHADYYLLRAKSYLKTTYNKESVIKDIEHAIHVYENAKPIPTSRLAESHFLLGQLLAASNIKQAANELKKAIKLDIGMADAHYELGKLLSLGGEYGDAISKFNKAISLNDKLANAYFERAQANLKLLGNKAPVAKHKKLLEEALSDYNLAIKHNPGNGQYVYARAELVEKLSDQPQQSPSKEMQNFNPVRLKHALTPDTDSKVISLSPPRKLQVVSRPESMYATTSPIEAQSTRRHTSIQPRQLFKTETTSVNQHFSSFNPEYIQACETPSAPPIEANHQADTLRQPTIYPNHPIFKSIEVASLTPSIGKQPIPQPSRIKVVENKTSKIIENKPVTPITDFFQDINPFKGNISSFINYSYLGDQKFETEEGGLSVKKSF